MHTDGEKEKKPFPNLSKEVAQTANNLRICWVIHGVMFHLGSMNLIANFAHCIVKKVKYWIG